MKLSGSCHCGAVRFALESHEASPYMRCYCSICRKTAGGGGYAINLGGDHRTLEVEGRDSLSAYSARMADGSTSQAQRHFCKHCGSALWVWDPRWPELVHPHASAIDSALPAPPSSTHIMLGSKAVLGGGAGRAEGRALRRIPDRIPGAMARAHGPGEVRAERASDRQRIDVHRPAQHALVLRRAARAAAAATRRASAAARRASADSTSICMRSTSATRATAGGTGG